MYIFSHLQICTGTSVPYLSSPPCPRGQRPTGWGRRQWAAVVDQTGYSYGRLRPIPTRNLEELWEDRMAGRYKGKFHLQNILNIGFTFYVFMNIPAVKQKENLKIEPY